VLELVNNFLRLRGTSDSLIDVQIADARVIARPLHESIIAWVMY
jgi:hypothetical protein